MVLSYYIATQTVEHLRFLIFFVCFLTVVLFLFIVFEKQNATHSSSKPHLVERDFYFENDGLVPALQTTGSYHRQDLCLFTVGRASQDQWGVEEK